MQNKITRKLFGCFAVALLLFALLVGLLFTSLFRRYTVAHHEEELLAKTWDIAASLEEQLGEGTDPHDTVMQYFQTVNRLLPEELWLVEKEDHRIIIVLGDHAVGYDNLPAAAKVMVDSAMSGAAISGQEFTAVFGDSTLTMGVPIRGNQDEIIAALLVHASLSGMEEAIREGIRLLLIAFLVAMVIALLASVIMSTVFNRPIRAMQIAANHMAEGDYGVTTGVSSKDELGALAKDLDTLALRLNEASKESEKLEQLRRDFVSNVSHELRTPVTVLRSSLEALCENVITDREIVADYHDSMLKETIHLQHMIADLLEVSRLQNPDYVIQFVPMDLVQAIDDAIRSAARIAETKGIAIKREVSTGSVLVLGDYSRIHQLILILLDNAIKFSPENSQVELCLCCSAASCVLMVMDHGPGVSEQDLPYVFDKFYSAQSPANPHGTGLGLHIAKQIAQRHSADIHLDNMKKGGCRITVVFPRKQIALPEDLPQTEGEG